ncbi:Rap1a/Tai family immunity protein [Bordetella genomosp. 13]|uniref:Rap1a/Tai family immunity protein n=1 Tax=Bordetella genomosp. 13 TaxID=463040 RepID=UPI0011A2DF1D|nr:Rap1a/Tai family immunity protein [Bordetella genomosp. 13]
MISSLGMAAGPVSAASAAASGAGPAVAPAAAHATEPAAAAAPAATPATHWQLTGEQLISAGIDGSLAPEFHDEKRPELQVMVSASRAAAFVLGVASYTHGTRWCKAEGLGPDDFQKVVGALGDLPDERLTTPAAPLIAEALAKFFPCKR